MAQSYQTQMDIEKMNNHKKDPRTLWVVVKVESGVPVIVEAYYRQKTARSRERLLRRNIREDYDTVNVFEVEIDSQDPV